MSAEFADDLAIAVTGCTIEEIIEKLEQIINKIVEWTKKWELTLGVGSTYEDIQILKRLLFFKVLYHRKG